MASSSGRKLISAPQRIPPARWLPNASTHDPSGWQVILRNQGVVVLFNRNDRSLAVEAPATSTSVPLNGAGEDDGFAREDGPAVGSCPLCKRPFQAGASRNSVPTFNTRRSYRPLLAVEEPDEEVLSTDYFHLLGESHHGSPSPTPEPSRPGTPEIGSHLDSSSFLEGYYSRFFVEVADLGRGMTGTVHLCQHVLNGNTLGYFACKKIPVGNSSPSLTKALREIKHLEALRHPNIIALHHVWLETASLHRGPPVPCLFALMDYANDGSLDAYIRSRGGLKRQECLEPESAETLKARARSRRTRSRSPLSEDVRAVHLFGLEEVISLCSDIASGLAFLHANNLLHLDLKAENILLNRNHEDLSLLPVAMLSDFGSAEARNAVARKMRSGTTGTLDYLAPEAFRTLPNGRARPHTAELDLWALGLVVHLIVFYELPYLEVDVDRLTDEIKAYPGYKYRESQHRRRDIPFELCSLIERLVNVNPEERPSAENVYKAIQSLKPASTSVPSTLAAKSLSLVKSVVPAPKAVTKLSEAPIEQIPAVDAGKAPSNALKPIKPFFWLLFRAMLFMRVHTTQCRRQGTMSMPVWMFVLLIVLAMLETALPSPDWVLLLLSSVDVLLVRGNVSLQGDR